MRFVIQRDSRKRFRFASLQSAVAAELLGQPDARDSVVLVEGAKVYRKSCAVLRIARRLDPPWPLLAAFLIVPRPLRDAAYDWIGRRRFRWFGRKEACWRPEPHVAERFIDR